VIPNITKGSKPVGLMKYLIGPGRRNEHVDPHLIAGSPTLMAWFDDAQLSDESAVGIAHELDLNRRTYGVEMDKHIWHCSLALGTEDREVTDQDWADIAVRFMDAMDFTEAGGKAPCQWVAVHHGKSVAGNDHIHIVASRVREDGTKWHDGADFSRAQKAARTIEKEFGLIQLGRHSERGYKPSEKQHGTDREPARFRLERTVRACAVASTHEAQFVRRMRRAGLLVHPRFADGGPSVVTGFSVAERPPKGMRPLWYGGGKLAKDLTLPQLRTRWPEDVHLAGEAADEWTAAKRHRRIVHGEADPVVLDEVTARRMADDLAEARRRLSGVAPDDHQTWAHAAREASGVFAAWSRAAEPEPGPLAQTARVLARSAHRSGVKLQRPLDPPLRMAGTAAFMLAATSASPMAQAMILAQMIRLARAIHDMHTAGAEARESRMIAETVQKQLAAVAVPLPEVPKTPAAGAHAGPNQQARPLRETDGPTARPHTLTSGRTNRQGMER
jgi:hypothetical protein